MRRGYREIVSAKGGNDGAHSRATSAHGRSTLARFDASRAAFFLLRAGFVILPIAVGIDKFFDNLADWPQYLWVGVPNTLHVSASTLMHTVGVIEIAAGLLVLFLPELRGAVVTVWLAGIITNLVLVAHDEHEYWDIAVRDFGLLIAAASLTLLAVRYGPLVGRRVHGGHDTPADERPRQDSNLRHTV